MTSTAYYALLTLGLVVLAALTVPPLVKFFRLIQEGERETEAAKRRIAERQLAGTHLPAIPDSPPDPEEQT